MLRSSILVLFSSPCLEYLGVFQLEGHESSKLFEKCNPGEKIITRNIKDSIDNQNSGAWNCGASNNHAFVFLQLVFKIFKNS